MAAKDKTKPDENATKSDASGDEMSATAGEKQGDEMSVVRPSEKSPAAGVSGVLREVDPNASGSRSMLRSVSQVLGVSAWDFTQEDRDLVRKKAVDLLQKCHKERSAAILLGAIAKLDALDLERIRTGIQAKEAGGRMSSGKADEMREALDD